ncbi:TPA: helix-turn-helix domain-containing protein [Clostridium perfringens]
MNYTLGNRIKEERLKLNLSGEEFGKILNVTKTAVSNWENNKREPDIQTLIKISKYFNVSIDYLLGNSNTSSNTLNSNGKRIKKLRKLYNMTSKELSELLGISQVYLSYIENEKRMPSLELIEKTCEIFNISLNTFFDKNNNEKTLGDYIEFYLSKNNINYKNITPDKKEEFAKSLVNLFIILNNK